jgi:hypothetical protein
MLEPGESLNVVVFGGGVFSGKFLAAFVVVRQEKSVLNRGNQKDCAGFSPPCEVIKVGLLDEGVRVVVALAAAEEDDAAVQVFAQSGPTGGVFGGWDGSTGRQPEEKDGP